jgi:hypothetical protein
MNRVRIAASLAVMVLAARGIAGPAEKGEPGDDGESKTMSEETSGYFDAHVHAYDCRKDGLDAVAAWMKACNVNRCIIHPLADSRPKNETERKQMVENYREYEGKIDRFCIIFPGEVATEEEAVKLLKKEKDDGAIGFGEHYGKGLAFDDPANMRLYAACAAVGLPVMFHMVIRTRMRMACRDWSMR